MLSSSPFHSTARALVLTSPKLEAVAAKLAAHSPSKAPPLHRPQRPSLRTIYASVSAAPGISAPAAESISPQFTNSIVEAPARESSLKTSNNSSFVLQQDGNGPLRQPPPTGEADDSSASRSAGSQQASLMLQAGCHIMPHPDKVDKGGEDACFIADSQLALGVADGVGGWAEVGVDAGAYAKKLMEEAKRAAEAGHHPHAVLKQAHANTQVQGSSTACVVRLDKTTLHTANLGDSGVMIVRDGKVVFQTPQQQHSFNFPYQMGSDEGVGDSPEMAEIYAPTVQPGDIVVAGTDGLFDNVFAEEIAVVATQCKRRGSTSQEAAQVMCMYARARAADQNYASPFAYGAFQAGFPFLGGKMDDITVVVAYVVPSSKL